jgi:hypothetical protein
MSYTKIDYDYNKSRKKIAPRDKFSSKELSLGFKKTWDLIEEYFKRKDFLACYVLTFSVMEDRLNSCYKVSLWKSRSKKFDIEDVPSYEDIYLSQTKEKINLLKDDFLITETLEKQLYKVIGERNTKFHSTMWVLEEFTKSAIIDLVAISRDLDRVRRKQKKIMGK